MMKQYISGIGVAVLLVTSLPLYGQTTPNPALPGTGTISGAVVDNTGKPITGAIVSLSLDLPAPTAGQTPAAFKPFQSISVTAADGTFSAGNLPSGLMKVCVQAPNSVFVEVCRWPLAQTTVTMSTGQSVSLPTISMILGFPLQIRVNDASGVLSTPTVGPKAPGVNVGVFPDTHLFVHARQVSRDATGYNYQVLVPFGLSLHVSVTATGVALANSAGATVAGGNFSTPVTVPSGTTSLAPITVSVTSLTTTLPGH
jgi:hypothetical protein